MCACPTVSCLPGCKSPSAVGLTFVATFGSVGADSVTVRTAYLAAESYSSTATNKVRSAPSARAVMG